MTGNIIFREIFKEQAKAFITSFQDSSKRLFFNPEKQNNLHHAGEFGVFRERIVAEFLRLFTPGRLEIGSGFVIAPNEKVSKQTDIILFDKNESPLIKTDEGQKFFPIETIASIGEIKSDMSQDQLRTELNSLVAYKVLRENLGDRTTAFTRSPLGITDKIAQEIIPDPKQFPNDQISTFLICSKFNFQVTPETAEEKINTLYDSSVLDRQKVDFILSLKDGFIGYYNQEVKEFSLNPNYGNDNHKLDMVEADDVEFDHIKQFVNLYYNKIFLTTILKPEFSEYIII